MQGLALIFPAGQSPGFPVLVASPRHGPVPWRAEQAAAGHHPRGLRPQLLHGLRGEHPGHSGQVARYFTLLESCDPGILGMQVSRDWSTNVLKTSTVTTPNLSPLSSLWKGKENNQDPNQSVSPHFQLHCYKPFNKTEQGN